MSSSQFLYSPATFCFIEAVVIPMSILLASPYAQRLVQNHKYGPLANELRDNTIIATAIPRITDHFRALEDVGWYGSAYFLTGCAFQLFFGKLYSFFSIKWVFLGALGVFELGSLICGVAPTSTTLIIGRAIAGIGKKKGPRPLSLALTTMIGSAGIFSGAVLIIAHSVPLAKRSLYTAMIAGKSCDMIFHIGFGL